MLDLLVGLPLAPLLLMQGVAAGRRAEKLPEAPGPRAGTAGSGPPLRLLILGDSSAAGVGAPDQATALAGQLVATLTPWYTVSWELVARTGFTTRDILAEVDRRTGMPPVDVAVTALGINDITHGASVTGWLRRQAALVDSLQRRCGAGLVLLSGLPPLGRFPLLPWPLRWVLGERARRFEAARLAWVAGRPGCRVVPLVFDGLGPEQMASDGFHPGPVIYARWGARLAQEILRF